MLPSPEETLEISVADLAALLPADAPPAVRLIDCREDDEFAICKIGGATLTPLSKFPDSTLPLLEAPGELPLVVYCHHGMRSLRATEWLRSHGHSRAWSMKGGIHAWSERIDPEVPKY